MTIERCAWPQTAGAAQCGSVPYERGLSDDMSARRGWREA